MEMNDERMLVLFIHVFLFFISLLISHLNTVEMTKILLDHYKTLGNLAVSTTPQNVKDFSILIYPNFEIG